MMLSASAAAGRNDTRHNVHLHHHDSGSLEQQKSRSHWGQHARSTTAEAPASNPAKNSFTTHSTFNLKPPDVGALLDLGLALGHQRFEVVSLAARDRLGMVAANAWAEPQTSNLRAPSEASVKSRRRHEQESAPSSESVWRDVGQTELRREVVWLRERVENLGRELVLAKRDSGRLAKQLKQEERVGREQRRRTDEVLREADALRDEVKRLKRDARMAATVASRGALSDAQDRTVRMAERRRRQQAESLMQAYKGLYEEQLQIQHASAKGYRSLDRKSCARLSAVNNTDGSWPATPTPISSVAPITAPPTSAAATSTSISPPSTLNFSTDERLSFAPSITTAVQELHEPGHIYDSETNDLELPLSSSASVDGHPSTGTQERMPRYREQEAAPFVHELRDGSEERGNTNVSGKTSAEPAAAVTTPAAAVAAAAGALAAAASSCSDKDMSQWDRSSSLEGSEECARELALVNAAQNEGGREFGLPTESTAAGKAGAVTMLESPTGSRMDGCGQHTEAGAGFWGAVAQNAGTRDDEPAKSPTGSDSTAETLACSPVGVGEDDRGGQAEILETETEQKFEVEVVAATFLGNSEKREDVGNPRGCTGREHESGDGNTMFTPTPSRHLFHQEVCEGDAELSSAERCFSGRSNDGPTEADALSRSAGVRSSLPTPRHSHQSSGDAEYSFRNLSSADSSEGVENGAGSPHKANALSLARRVFSVNYLPRPEPPQRFVASSPEGPAPAWRGRCSRGKLSEGRRVLSSASRAQACEVDAPKRSTSPDPARRGRWSTGTARNQAWGDEVGNVCTRIEPSRTRPHSI